MNARFLLWCLVCGFQFTAVIATEPIDKVVSSGIRLDQTISPLVRNDLKVDSSASCSATACHGGPRAGVSNTHAIRGSEYPLWYERDPHARSWRTICGEKSFAIMQRLSIIGNDGTITNQVAFDNCLACHNSTRQFVEPRSSQLLREGVGCNACHGPSESWKSTHYQSNWLASNQVDNGFVPTATQLEKARLCAVCHIGDKDRDLNHEMIAAGHPNLYYEYTTFYQRQPKHWRDPEASDLSRFESSQWLAGQLAALDASMALTEARANKKLANSQPNDFASYQCSACHQKLRPGSLDYSQQQPLGSPQLSRWNRFGVEELLHLRIDTGAASERDRQLADVLIELTRITSLTSNIAEERIAEAAQRVRTQLDKWINSPEGRNEIINMSASRLKTLLIHAGKQPETFANWESAGQFYLASVASRADWPVDDQCRSLATARQLRAALTFQPGTSAIQSEIWRETFGFKKIPFHAGEQHWHAIQSASGNHR